MQPVLSASKAPLPDAIADAMYRILSSDTSRAIWCRLLERPEHDFSCRELFDDLRELYLAGGLEVHEKSCLAKEWTDAGAGRVRKFLRERITKGIISPMERLQIAGELPQDLPFKIVLYTKRQGDVLCSLHLLKGLSDEEKECEFLQSSVVSRTSVAQRIFELLREHSPGTISHELLWYEFEEIAANLPLPERLTRLLADGPPQAERDWTPFRSYCLDTLHKSIIEPLRDFYETGEGRFRELLAYLTLYRYNEAPQIASLRIVPNTSPGNMRIFRYGRPSAPTQYLEREVQFEAAASFARNPVTALVGPPGLGKTDIARQLLQPGVNGGQPPRAILFYPLQARADQFRLLALELARLVVNSFDADPKPFQYTFTQETIDLPTLANQLSHVLADHSWVVSLDDCHAIEEGSLTERFLMLLLSDMRDGQRLLLAGRSLTRSLENKAKVFEVTTFSEDETHGYLRKRIPSYSLKQIDDWRQYHELFEGTPQLLKYFCDWWEGEGFTAEALKRFQKYRVRGSLRVFAREFFNQCTTDELQLLQVLSQARSALPLESIDTLHPQANRALPTLLSRGILVTTGNQVKPHAFFETYFKESAAGSNLTAEERRNLHQRLAEFWLRFHNQAEALHHYLCAEDPVKAAEIALRSVMNGFYLGNIQDVIKTLREVLSQLRRTNQALKRQGLIGELHVALLYFTDLQGERDATVELETRIQQQYLRELSSTFSIRFWLHRYTRALREENADNRKEAVRALDLLFGEEPQHPLKASFNLKRGIELLKRRDYDEAQAILHEAKEAATRQDDEVILVEVYRYLGWLSTDLQQFQAAGDWYDRGLELTRKLGNQALESVLLESMGTLAIRQRRTDDAFGLLLQAAEKAMQHGVFTLAGSIYGNVGTLYHHQAKFIEALKNYERALTGRLRVQDANRLAQIGALATDVAMRLGHEGEGSERVSQLVAMTPWEDLSPMVGQFVRYVCGMVFRGLRNNQAAQAMFEQSLRICREHQVEDYIAFNCFSLGSLFVEEGDDATGWKFLDEPAEALDGEDDIAMAGHYHMARALLHQGKTKDATVHLDRAEALARKLDKPDSQKIIHKVRLGYQEYGTLLVVYGL